ncbi:formyltetrahydrofolate deformylase [Jatrophihabitans endophyticus]|uniref:formyltetrahydrofolate deformylase n=1 Tax=Jatrophihabitans endophyticus TaxID=1206085 RepID=UPI0019FDE79A|nr:formyltetrahydrofolate deformylase [Jatrophihabitans endophyticus]MBE7186920.1 formyltetrahydrofolate deformylase [Jatrophihabitans endophyticus]
MQPDAEQQHEYVLTITCPDRPGIVYAVSAFLVHSSANILESQQYDDRLENQFFMRVHFEVHDTTMTLDRLRAAFTTVADAANMTWHIWAADARYRTLVMVSKEGHCLNDLLYRQSIGALPIEIPAIVSNHTDLERLAKSYDVPFHHIPVTAATKPEAEAELLQLVESLGIDLVVLARYMQILSDDACRRLEGRAINIHHSFLPSFKGARPYQQAFDRGVKLVGATAHYVSSDLDEGPIIEQDVTRVDHSLTAAQLVAAGRDVESQVLSRAVRWHAETRVLLDGHRTVVFR